MSNEIKNITDYISKIQEIHRLQMPKKNLFYRGVSKSKYDLKPKIFRDTAFKERDVLLDYKHFLPRTAPMYDFPKDILKILTDMQHYGVPTRLLDWSMAPLTALYFACCNNLEVPTENNDPKENDGKVYILNAWKLWSRIIPKPENSDIHQIHIQARALLTHYKFDEVKKRIKREFDFEIDEARIQLPFPFVASYSNNRIIAQKGCFTIHGTDLKELSGQEVSVLTISRLNKEQIINELNLLGIDDYLLFPDFEGMTKSFNRKKSLFNL